MNDSLFFPCTHRWEESRGREKELPAACLTSGHLFLLTKIANKENTRVISSPYRTSLTKFSVSFHSMIFFNIYFFEALHGSLEHGS